MKQQPLNKKKYSGTFVLERVRSSVASFTLFPLSSVRKFPGRLSVPAGTFWKHFNWNIEKQDFGKINTGKYFIFIHFQRQSLQRYIGHVLMSMTYTDWQKTALFCGIPDLFVGNKHSHLSHCLVSQSLAADCLQHRERNHLIKLSRYILQYAMSCKTCHNLHILLSHPSCSFFIQCMDMVTRNTATL